MIAFYYGLTGFACAWYFRGAVRRGARATFTHIVRADDRRADPLRPLLQGGARLRLRSGNYTTSLLGMGTPVWIGVGGLARRRGRDALTRALLPGPFWQRRGTGQADPALLG